MIQSYLNKILYTLLFIPFASLGQNNLYYLPDTSFVNLLEFLDENLIVNDSLNIDQAEIYEDDWCFYISNSSWSSYGPIYDLEGIQYFSNINCLNIQGHLLENIPNLSDLNNLSQLNIYYSPNLTNLGELSGLSNLTYLSIGETGLTVIPDLSGLSSLEYLDFRYNDSLTVIPNLSGLTNLTSLSYDHNNLTSIPAFSGLNNLEELYIHEDLLTSIPDFSGLTNLKYFQIYCSSLTNLPELSGLNNLEWLGIYDCYELLELPELSGLNNLNSLEVGWCNNLINIPDLSSLTNLEYLWLEYNDSLECVGGYPPQLYDDLLSYPPICADDILGQIYQSFDSWNVTIDLEEGWNMIGYGCPSTIDIAECLYFYTEYITILKDNFGSVYMPEWNFNGIGDFTSGFGYQIKLTEAIEGLSLCDWYVNDIPEDQIIYIQMSNSALETENSELIASNNLLNEENDNLLVQNSILQAELDSINCNCYFPDDDAFTDWLQVNIPSVMVGNGINIDAANTYSGTLNIYPSNGNGNAITNLDGLQHFYNISNLYIRHLDNLTSIPNISGFINLSQLFIDHNEVLSTIPVISEVPNLNTFHVYDCPQLTLLPDLSGFSNVHSFYINDCDNLIFIPDLSEFTELNEFEIYYDNISLQCVAGYPEYIPNATYGDDDDVILPPICDFGCIDNTALNYNQESHVDDGSCCYDEFDCILGCSDSSACNYVANTDVDDGSCVYPEQGYDCQGNWDLQIGDFYQGGVVIYLDSISNETGIIAAIEDLDGTYEWGCYGQDILTTGKLIGDGYQNTFDIINANCQTLGDSISAAEAAYNYENEGYSDWYLPSLNEFLCIAYSDSLEVAWGENIEMSFDLFTNIWTNYSFLLPINYLNLAGGAYSNFPSCYDTYWTSSEIDIHRTSSVAFNCDLDNYYNLEKYNSYRVRPIRYFGNWPFEE